MPIWRTRPETENEAEEPIEEDDDQDVEPLEYTPDEETGADESIKTDWYILKVQVNREESIRAR